MRHTRKSQPLLGYCESSLTFLSFIPAPHAPLHPLPLPNFATLWPLPNTIRGSWPILCKGD